ncbi:MAG: CARDB domain-containing protein, partial [Solirubrobacteraceae bacterium]
MCKRAASLLTVLACALAPVLLTLTLLAAPAASASEPTSLPAPSLSDTAASTTANAALTQCTVAVEQPERSSTFAGQMVAITATQRMMMRINVQERAPGQSIYHTINAPGLGSWRSSEAGVKVYKYFRQVTNLPAPGDFRGVITFRWLAAKGHVLRQTVRHTQSCQQPDERPKLVIGQVQVEPIFGSSNAYYEIEVNNEGRSGAGAFTVLLTVNGRVEPEIPIASLASGSSTVVAASVGACASGSTIEVQPDPHQQIEEARGGGVVDK